MAKCGTMQLTWSYWCALVGMLDVWADVSHVQYWHNELDNTLHSAHTVTALIFTALIFHNSVSIHDLIFTNQ